MRSSAWHATIAHSLVCVVRCQELPWILKGVSCSIQPREKIGICGRTGSGKSSLMVSLFRIVEAPNRGSILIDGIDIATVGLLSLRSALSIIPQDPVLFSGTIRLNLDPFHQRTDEQLWVALAQVSLKSFVLSQPQGLESNVAEYGDNFSSGQVRATQTRIVAVFLLLAFVFLSPLQFSSIHLSLCELRMGSPSEATMQCDRPSAPGVSRIHRCSLSVLCSAGFAVFSLCRNN